MHSRKSRTFRSYIRNARARVGKVAGTRDISNRYRSRCLFDSSFILFLFPFLSFLLFPPLSLSLSLFLHNQGLLMPRLEFDTLENRGNYIVFPFPAVSRATQDSTRVYIRISKSMDKSRKRNLSGEHATSTDISSRDARSRELEGLMWFREGREVARRMDRMFRKPPENYWIRDVAS